MKFGFVKYECNKWKGIDIVELSGREYGGVKRKKEKENEWA